MKLKEVIFKKPKAVIQVYQKINIYTKELRSFADRKDTLLWTSLNSTAGYIAEGELYLPPTVPELNNFSHCDMITMEDGTLIRSGYIDRVDHTSANHILQLSHTRQFEIFDIKRNENLEVHLRYDNWNIGMPKRKNFKICDLMKDKPVEIKINGRISSYSGQYYKEQAYILHYIGDFGKCHLLREPVPPVTKEIPADRKVIDLNAKLF